MFSGSHTPKLDEKGRLFLPAKFRDEMKEGLVITEARNVPSTSARGPTSPCSPRSSRTRRRPTPASGPTAGCCSRWPRSRSPTSRVGVTITPELRQYAGLDRDAVVIGVYDRIEVWEPGSWTTYTADQEQAFANLQEEIFPGF